MLSRAENFESGLNWGFHGYFYELPLNRIRSLYMATDLLEPSSQKMRLLAPLVRNILVQFTALHQLTIEIPLAESKLETTPFINTLRAITTALRLDYKWTVCSPGSQHNVAIFWDAGRHGVLTWMDCDFWKSIPWGNIGILFTVLVLSLKICFWPVPNLHSLGLTQTGHTASLKYPCYASSCSKRDHEVGLYDPPP